MLVAKLGASMMYRVKGWRLPWDAGTALALIVILALVEMGCRSFPILGRIGIAAQCQAYLLLVSLGTRDLTWLCARARWNRGVCTLACLTLLGVGIFGGMLAPTHVSFDTAQIVRCGLRQLETAGAGFNGWCFLGYPNRGIVVTSLPTLFAGEGITALNLMPPLLLFAGLIVFARALLERSSAGGVRADVMVAFLLALLLQSRSFLVWLFEYDITMLPVALSLWLSAAFLALWRDGARRLPVVALVLLLHATAYTTALPGLCVGLAALAYWALVRERTLWGRVGAVSACALAAAVFIASFAYRTDVRLGAAPGAQVDRMERVLEMFRLVFLRSAHEPEHGVLLAIVFTLTLFWALLYREGIKGVVASLAIIGTCLLAAAVQGYSFYAIPRAMYRIVPVYPLLFLLATGWIEPLARKLPRAFPAVMGIALLALLVVDGRERFLPKAFSRAPAQRLAWVLWIQDLLRNEVLPRDATIHLDPSLWGALDPAWNAAEYFVPGVPVLMRGRDCSLSGSLGSSPFFFGPETGGCPRPVETAPVATRIITGWNSRELSYVLEGAARK